MGTDARYPTRKMPKRTYAESEGSSLDEWASNGREFSSSPLSNVISREKKSRRQAAQPPLRTERHTQLTLRVTPSGSRAGSVSIVKQPGGQIVRPTILERAY